MKINIDLSEEKENLKNFDRIEFADYLFRKTIVGVVIPLMFLLSGLFTPSVFLMFVFAQTISIALTFLFLENKPKNKEKVMAYSPTMEPPTTKYVVETITGTPTAPTTAPSKPKVSMLNNVHNKGVLVVKEDGALVRMDVPEKYKLDLGKRFPKYADTTVPVPEQAFVEWVFMTFGFDEAITYFADIRRRDMRLLESKSHKLDNTFVSFHSNPYAIKYIDTNNKGELTFETANEVNGEKVNQDMFNDFQNFASRTRVTGLPTRKDFESWVEDYAERNKTAKETVEAIFTTT
jgi:hypothetical protein